MCCAGGGREGTGREGRRGEARGRGGERKLGKGRGEKTKGKGRMKGGRKSKVERKVG